MKGVSYIVASILMLIITVALSGTAYMFISGVFTAGIQGIEIANAYCSLGEVTFKIKNIGTSAITGLDIEQTNPTDDFLTPSFQGTIEPGKTVNYQDTCEGEQSRKCIYRITPPTGKTITSEATCSGRPESLVLSMHFDEESGIVAKDPSGNGNDGTLSRTLFGDFEGTLDGGFSLGCGGGSASSYVPGKMGSGLKIWSTGGVACAFKSLGPDKSTGYTVWFYGKGYVRAGIHDGIIGDFITRVEDSITGCSTPNIETHMYTWCNGGLPYLDWRLFKLVTYQDSAGAAPSLYFFNNGSIGEQYAGYYDFITDGPGWVKGKHGNALSFDGVDDNVSVSHGTPTLDNDFTELTVSAWVYINSFNTGAADFSTPIVSDWNTWSGGSQEGYLLRAFYSSSEDKLKWQFSVANGGDYLGVDYDKMHSTDFSNKYENKWLHLVGVFENGILRLYIDGVLANTAVSTFSQIQPEISTPVWIGYTGINANYTNGTIDEIRIYNKALI